MFSVGPWTLVKQQPAQVPHLKQKVFLQCRDDSVAFTFILLFFNLFSFCFSFFLFIISAMKTISLFVLLFLHGTGVNGHVRLLFNRVSRIESTPTPSSTLVFFLVSSNTFSFSFPLPDLEFGDCHKPGSNPECAKSNRQRKDERGW